MTAEQFLVSHCALFIDFANDGLILFGGRQVLTETPMLTTYFYSVKERKWDEYSLKLPPNYVPSEGSSCVQSRRSNYGLCVGGQDVTRASVHDQMFMMDFETKALTRVGRFPYKMFGGHAFEHNDEIYVFAGSVAVGPWCHSQPIYKIRSSDLRSPLLALYREEIEITRFFYGHLEISDLGYEKLRTALRAQPSYSFRCTLQNVHDLGVSYHISEKFPCAIIGRYVDLDEDFVKVTPYNTGIILESQPL
jgi:hypothetical protein